MNKVELINTIASKINLTKKDIENVINSFEEIVINVLQKGDKVTLTGFGGFEARIMKSRTGVNPQTGAKIVIPTTTVPKFRAGKSFKDALKK
ncbi:MAG: HU family DNA-binding protein [Patescibacteria group bacterium]|nr:HU family DNA-binding protein [Patescibacteria group bacterium]MDD4303882.1 HU family DNA-binding protein [Patescibacteria group bacterium]MDD4695131.1 HU family DNA-binding protein [Patescibacteria group bacterium]